MFVHLNHDEAPIAAVGLVEREDSVAGGAAAGEGIEDERFFVLATNRSNEMSD